MNKNIGNVEIIICINLQKCKNKSKIPFLTLSMHTYQFSNTTSKSVSSSGKCISK